MLTNELITPLNLCHLTGMLRRSNVLWLRAISCQSSLWQQGPLFLHCLLIHTRVQAPTQDWRIVRLRHVWNTCSVLTIQQHTPENVKLQWKLQSYFNAFALFLVKCGAIHFFFQLFNPVRNLLWISVKSPVNPNLKTHGRHLRPLQVQSNSIIFTWNQKCANFSNRLTMQLITAHY